MQVPDYRSSQSFNINNLIINNDFESIVNKLKEVVWKNKNDWVNSEKPSVLILGAGPAGLIHAIESVLQGNQTVVIEKRSQESPGRENAVALRIETVEILKNYGIFQYLLKYGLIYPPSNDQAGVNVRLKDLEEGMKFILTQISGQNLILYDSQTVEVIQQPEKKLDIKIQVNGEITRLSNVDILLNTEGAHSHTQKNLLHIERDVLLPSVPVITAIFKDDRPEIVDTRSFVTYTKKTLIHTVKSIYYHARFVFSYLTHINSVYQWVKQIQQNNQTAIPGPIKGVAILPTPGQNYVGIGLGIEESNKLTELCKRVEDAVKALHGNAGDKILTLKMDRAKKDLNKYMECWANHSICWYNSFFPARMKVNLNLGLPLQEVKVAYIGVDCIRQAAGMNLGESLYLAAGDAYATTDATTGRGCNTAIEAVSAFISLTKGLKLRGMHKSLKKYSLKLNAKRERNSLESLQYRQLFRPDTISKAAIFKVNCKIDPSEDLSEDEMIILNQWSQIKEMDISGFFKSCQALKRIKNSLNTSEARVATSESLTRRYQALEQVINYLANELHKDLPAELIERAKILQQFVLDGVER